MEQRGGLQRYPFALGTTVQGDRQVGVDEQVLVEGQYRRHAVAEVRGGRHARKRCQGLLRHELVAQSHPHCRCPARHVVGGNAMLARLAVCCVALGWLPCQRLAAQEAHLHRAPGKTLAFPAVELKTNGQTVRGRRDRLGRGGLHSSERNPRQLLWSRHEPQGARATHHDTVGAQLRLERLYAATGTRDAGVELQWRHRHRAQEFKGQARERQLRAGLHTLKRRRDQCRRRTAVKCARVPRTTRVLGWQEAVPVGDEDAHAHGGGSYSRRRARAVTRAAQAGSCAAKSASLSGSRNGAPWPNSASAGRNAASLRIDARFCAGSTANSAGGSLSPGMPVMRFMLLITSPRISTLSDSRQKETCPRVWPGVSRTVNPATSSPSRSARETGWGGPTQ